MQPEASTSEYESWFGDDLRGKNAIWPCFASKYSTLNKSYACWFHNYVVLYGFCSNIQCQNAIRSCPQSNYLNRKNQRKQQRPPRTYFLYFLMSSHSVSKVFFPPKNKIKLKMCSFEFHIWIKLICITKLLKHLIIIIFTAILLLAFYGMWVAFWQMFQ